MCSVKALPLPSFLSAPDIIRAAFGPAALEGGGLIRKARRCPPSGSQTDESP